MKLKKWFILIFTHLSMCVFGFAMGIYILPILIAPPSLSDSEIATLSSQATYSGKFTKDLADSDLFHWGEGKVFVSSEMITLMGKISPGPNFKLYLSPKFVETEVDFSNLKSSMVEVGDINTFENFMLRVPPTIDPSEFTTIVIWCEVFGEFITSAKYR